MQQSGVFLFLPSWVWVSEALNTAFEFLCDVASPEFHPLVKNPKMWLRERCYLVPWVPLLSPLIILFLISQEINN